jgi:hypothetical protein
MNRSFSPRRRRIALAATATLALGFAPSAFAQADWPRQPIKLIVPYAPGGANDVVLRLVSKHVQERLGQPILIDNRPGRRWRGGHQPDRQGAARRLHHRRGRDLDPDRHAAHESAIDGGRHQGPGVRVPAGSGAHAAGAPTIRCP